MGWVRSAAAGWVATVTLALLACSSDAPVTGDLDAGSDAFDAPHEDAEDAADTAFEDSGKPIVGGDPCPTGTFYGGCYENRAWDCTRGAPTDPGTIAFNALRDCSLMGGACVAPTSWSDGYAYCSGGGYTSCDPLTDHGQCWDTHTYKTCDATSVKASGPVYGAEDCGTVHAGYVCKASDAGASCAAP